MPTLDHEAAVLLLRACPALVPELLRDALHVPLAHYREVRVEDADFTQVLPAQFHADLVLTLADERPVMGLVVEVQLAIDADKRFSWPLYVAALHARLRVPCCLVVVTPRRSVAAWASRPVESFQLGSAFVPLVLGPDRIPRVTDVEAALRAPELAVLSALAHGDEPGGEEVAVAAITAASRLDDARGTLYTDLVLATIGEAVRVALEAKMATGGYEYRSEFVRSWVARIDRAREEGREEASRAREEASRAREEGREQGREQGREEGKALALLALLEARGIVVSAAEREHVLACRDDEQLDRWIRRGATAKTLGDVIGDHLPAG